MATSMKRALQQRFDGRMFVFLTVFVMLAVIVLGLHWLTVPLTIGSTIAGVSIASAIDAGYIHRQTYRVAVSVIFGVLIALFLLQTGSMQTILIFGLPFGSGLGWIVLDALAARHTGTLDPDGSVAGVADISEVITNVSVAKCIVTTLEIADRPMTVEEVATLCDLDYDSAASALAILEEHNVLINTGAGVSIEESRYGSPLVALFVRGVRARILQPFQLLATS